MATIFRRNGSPYWQVSYFYEGRRITKSLGTTDKTIAKAEKRKLEGRLAEKRHEEYGRTTLNDLFALYKASKGERGTLTNKHEFYTIAAFIASVNKRALDAVTEGDVTRFLTKYREKSPVTYKNVLAAIKRLFKFAVKKRKLSSRKNPTDGIEARRITREKPTFFSDAEYLVIEKAAEGHPIFPMIVVARYTGLRLAELRHLEWQDFDWLRREVDVRNKPEYGHTIKTYEERRVPISEELIYKLLPYKKESGLCFPSPQTGGAYSLQGPKKVLVRILKTAGVRTKGDGWHRFRRTFASRLVQRDIPIQKVSKWLGHSSITVTEKYYADFKPRYDEDIEKLNILESENQTVKIAS